MNAGLALLGLATAALAIAACATLAEGPHLLPLALADDVAADRAVDPGQSRQWTRSALATRPVDVASWLRLARLEAGSTRNQLSVAALQALDRSYAVGPYASQVLESRARFAYDHWNGLSPDLQAQVTSEVRTAWQVVPQRQRLLTASASIKNPAGSLVLSGLLLTLKLQGDVDAQYKKAHGGSASPSGG